MDTYERLQDEIGEKIKIKYGDSEVIAINKKRGKCIIRNDKRFDEITKNEDVIKFITTPVPKFSLFFENISISLDTSWSRQQTKDFLSEILFDELCKEINNGLFKIVFDLFPKPDDEYYKFLQDLLKGDFGIIKNYTVVNNDD